jgi:lipoprotein-anchoring transpeptidase ErfK/SrfK
MLTRRHLMATFAASLVPALPAYAEPDDEPFPVSRSDVLEVEYRFRRRQMEFKSKLQKGTLFADMRKKYLYYILSDDTAIRYGIGIGRAALTWEGEAVIKRKAKWPSWKPTPEMLEIYGDDPEAKWLDGIPGGLKNPLGARALYLYKNGVDTLFRIHGTNQPKTIGTASSRGCLRMINTEIIDLYDRVPVGSRIVVSRTGKLPT